MFCVVGRVELSSVVTYALRVWCFFSSGDVRMGVLGEAVALRDDS